MVHILAVFESKRNDSWGVVFLCEATVCEILTIAQRKIGEH